MLSRKVQALKGSHGLPPSWEIKWTKVSPAKLDFYLAAVDRFWTSPCFASGVS